MNIVLKGAFLAALIGNSLTLIQQLGPFHVYTIDLALGPLLVFVALKKLFNPRSLPFRWHVVDAMMLLVTCTNLVSYFFSIDRMHSLMGLMEWFRVLAFYFATRLLVGSVLSDRTLKFQFAVVFGLLSVTGLLQLITGQPIGLIGNLFGQDLDQFTSVSRSLGSRNRVSGTTPNSNVFAMWIVMFGGVFLSTWVARGKAVLFYIGAGLMTLIIMMSLSRGGVLGFAVFLGALLWINRQHVMNPKFVLLGLLAVVVLTGFLLVSYAVTSRLIIGEGTRLLIARQAQNRDLEEGGERRELIEAGMRMLRDPRTLAVGIGTDNMLRHALKSRGYEGVIARVPEEKLPTSRLGVHNVWVRTAVEQGVPTVLALAGLFGAFVLAARRGYATGDEEGRIWAAYLMALACCYLLVWTQVYLTPARLSMMIPMTAMLAIAATRLRPAEVPSASPRAERSQFAPSWATEGSPPANP